MPAVAANTVEICLFRFRQDRPEYLLLKRSASEDLYPGLWQIVTGTVGPGERGLDAAVREVREETSLRPFQLWVVPVITGFYDAVSDSISFIPAFAGQVDPLENPRLSDEHESFEWLPLDRAVRRLVWPGQKNLLEMVDQAIIRGAPAGILSAIPPESIP